MAALLIVASLVDGLLAILLVAVSGFVFGGGPEGMSGDVSGVVIWIAAFTACIAAPVGGFVLRGLGRPGPGVLVALLPLVFALLLTSGVVHPY